MKFLVQKVTRFDCILIEKVFFSNKNSHSNSMLTTCKQPQKSNGSDTSSQYGEQGFQEILMHDRIKDLFQTQHSGKMINCAKLNIYIPRDFV